MQKKIYHFSSKKVANYFNGDISGLDEIVDRKRAVIITDENVFNKQKKKFLGWSTIVIKPGEKFKTQATVNEVVERLIHLQADRKTFLVGVGGGVVTDITGYVGSIYMRGIPFGFVPSSLLAMVDAAIGGKNGVDVGPYKNLLGIIRQPEFLLYDVSLLSSLPETEWINGFAEIIKHAAIRDAAMFRELEKNKLSTYRRNKTALNDLIARNANIKSSIVKKDEWEHGDRRLLNFGHTLGHAIENIYGLPHGHAISIGMVAACHLSESMVGFGETERVAALLKKYGLPTELSIDANKVFKLLKLDKKRANQAIHYILVKKLGNAVVESIPIDELEKKLQSVLKEVN
ncbi:MAG: 3-dehydroquinate synthase [Bacteroidetes bacterium]|nr:MAG: 3-dehydroquinate synthase [Bacteroidota bacterium]